MPVLATGEVNSFIQPITFDDPQEDPEATRESQLTEFIGQEYILHSIVGSVFAARSAINSDGTNSSGVAAVLVWAGFFVARSASDSGQTTDSLPIGAASLSEQLENYAASSGSTIREPWIMRRAWVLGRGRKYDTTTGNPFVTTASPTAFREGYDGADFPPTTAGYSGLRSGPFFQTKTRRRVRQDERLWFHMSCCYFPLGREGTTGIDVYVDWYLDYRIFGQLVKAVNRSAF